MSIRREIGIIGEDYAVNLLIDEGYKVIDRNFRSHFGEIDIIAIHKDTLVFVEVKTRTSKKYGKPEEAVTVNKLKHIIRTSDYYCSTHNKLPKKKRIEVVALEVADKRIVSSKIIRV